MEGVGLHTGKKCRLTLKPAPPGTGIIFFRTDIGEEIPASIDLVQGVTRGTTIGTGEKTVHTVEHLLSAFSALEIDNLRVELSDAEPPIADGSAREFVAMIDKAGFQEQEKEKVFYKPSHPIFYRSRDTEIIAFPDEELKITCVVHYAHPILGTQYFSLAVTPESFKKELAPARTFCFDYEVEHLLAHGLGKGGTLENAIVVGEKRIHNQTPLRFPDEFVRHKIMDLLGDIFLIGKAS